MSNKKRIEELKTLSESALLKAALMTREVMSGDPPEQALQRAEAARALSDHALNLLQVAEILERMG